MLKYTPKVYLKFKLPNGTSKEGFYRQNQRLGEIISSFGVEGEPRIKIGKKMTKLDSNLSLSELGLRNDDIIELK